MLRAICRYMTNGIVDETPPPERQVELESVMSAFEPEGPMAVADMKRVDVEASLNVRYRLNVRGDIIVRGDISLVNADCAEEFDILPQQLVEPGTVMVLNEKGNLEPSCQAYEKKVVGVISGAGNYKPGLVLGKQQQEHQSEEGKKRMPIALMGKVYCKVDASLSSIEVGDLLTTSSTEGHAMKAADAAKAFGTVIGKALKL
jgi:hypothetical protein